MGWWGQVRVSLALELELIQTHKAQRPLLWVEVGAHAVHNRSKCAARACVCRRAITCGYNIVARIQIGSYICTALMEARSPGTCAGITHIVPRRKTAPCLWCCLFVCGLGF